MIRSVVIHSIRVRPNTVYVRIGKTEVEIPRGDLQEWLDRVASFGPEMLIAIAVMDRLSAGTSVAQLPTALNGKTLTLTTSVS